MMLRRLVMLHKLAENLPVPATIEQRVCLYFVRAGAECPQGRPLSWDDLRLLSGGMPDNSIRKALAKLLARGCVRHFEKRGVYLVNFDGEWPEDRRGTSEGSVLARTSKRNPRASRPYSVNTLKGLI
jgi:hypothetical protein